jgi:hypothetical protein
MDPRQGLHSPKLPFQPKPIPYLWARRITPLQTSKPTQQPPNQSRLYSGYSVVATPSIQIIKKYMTKLSVASGMHRKSP